MQKSRRWRGLEFNLLSVAWLSACAAAPKANGPETPSAEQASATPGAAAATANTLPLSADSESPANRASPGPAPLAAPEPGVQPLPKGTRVLQIGDSFAAALGGELSKLLK